MTTRGDGVLRSRRPRETEGKSSFQKFLLLRDRRRHPRLPHRRVLGDGAVRYLGCRSQQGRRRSPAAADGARLSRNAIGGMTEFPELKVDGLAVPLDLMVRATRRWPTARAPDRKSVV